MHLWHIYFDIITTRKSIWRKLSVSLSVSHLVIGHPLPVDQAETIVRLGHAFGSQPPRHADVCQSHDFSLNEIVLVAAKENRRSEGSIDQPYPLLCCLYLLSILHSCRLNGERNSNCQFVCTPDGLYGLYTVCNQNMDDREYNFFLNVRNWYKGTPQ